MVSAVSTSIRADNVLRGGSCAVPYRAWPAADPASALVQAGDRLAMPGNHLALLNPLEQIREFILHLERAKLLHQVQPGLC